MAKRHVNTDHLGQPSDPTEHICQWCGARAKHAHQIVRRNKPWGTALFVYTCEAHKALGAEATGHGKQSE